MTDPAIPPLVADLIAANVASLAQTTNRVIDDLTERLAQAHAEIAAIRIGVNELFAKPYAPSEHAIGAAVYSPSKDLIAECREHDWRTT